MQMWALSAYVNNVYLCLVTVCLCGHCLQMWTLSAYMGTVFSYTNCITSLSKPFMLLYKLIFLYPCHPSLHQDTPSLHPMIFSFTPKISSFTLCPNCYLFIGLFIQFFIFRANFFISSWFLMLLDLSLRMQMWALYAYVGTVFLYVSCKIILSNALHPIQ